MKPHSKNKQRGVSLGGFIVVLIVMAVLAVLGLKVVPTFTEYLSIKKAIATAKTSGTTAREIQSSFDKQAEVGYITAISGKDLEVTTNGNGIEINFSYEKKIPLIGPTSLLIDYSGSTAEKSR
jgi:type II secretory pathway pseudopilin PulG